MEKQPGRQCSICTHRDLALITRALTSGRKHALLCAFNPCVFAKEYSYKDNLAWALPIIRCLRCRLAARRTGAPF